MKQSKSIKNRPAHSQSNSLYEPLDFVFVRMPLLPVQVYQSLTDATANEAAPISFPVELQPDSLAPRDPRIRRALAVGNPKLLNALERSSLASQDSTYRLGKLLRYLIRMSTRPTPFGLFAGVALGRWGSHTDLALATDPPRSRTRPDMAWLYSIVMMLESRPEIRKHLSLVANPMAHTRAGRVSLLERAPTTGDGAQTEVSVRATNAVQRALAAARQPIAYQDLATNLLVTTPGATADKVEKLLTELWQQTLLLTDLRPPLTTDNPAVFVTRRLADIPTAQQEVTQLESILGAAATWDRPHREDGADSYRDLVKQANEMSRAVPETPFQVDMAWQLRGDCLTRVVGQEVARAGELLLRLSPFPNGNAILEAYRHMFESRYGYEREVELLEMLDPHYGLGPLPNHGGSASGISYQKSTERTQTLLDLALRAVRDGQLVVELDEATLSRLSLCSPSRDTAPVSLDINVFVAAQSIEALDRGDFQVVIGPNLGASTAGRNLGRFADLLGVNARAALADIVRREQAHTPDRILAELVYLPPQFHAANVSIRPAIRSHEITLAVSAGTDGSKVIPLDELLVGVRNGRFYVRWTRHDIEIVPCAGHMLSSLNAPAVCRFLSEVGRDGEVQLSSFDWGPAWGFPVLPRVQVGRIVLSPARWRINDVVWGNNRAGDSHKTFQENLERWRAKWQVPRYVYLSEGDNRLLLDLENSMQVEQLQHEFHRLKDGGFISLEEVLPRLDENWLPGPGGTYVAEFVSSLVLRDMPTNVQTKVESSKSLPSFHATPRLSVPLMSRLLPPGSDWLFLKLYGPRALEDDLIVQRLRPFAELVLSSGLADQWFFIRYSDPDPHLRIRFHGEPKRLIGELLLTISKWATELIADEVCLRFCFDTYDREVDRYGGLAGMQVAEKIFAADSLAVTELLYLVQSRALRLDVHTLAILGIDDLLAGLGLSVADRLRWYREEVTSRDAVSQEYLHRKTLLRAYLGNPNYLSAQIGGERLARVFTTRRAALTLATKDLAGLVTADELSQKPASLYRSFVHMHVNRLMGYDQTAEQRALGLLLRTRQGLDRAPVVPHFILDS